MENYLCSRAASVRDEATPPLTQESIIHKTLCSHITNLTSGARMKMVIDISSLLQLWQRSPRHSYFPSHQRKTDVEGELK